MQPPLGLEHHVMRLERLATQALTIANPPKCIGIEGETVRELSGPPINITEQVYPDDVRILEVVTSAGRGEQGSPLYDKARDVLSAIIEIGKDGKVTNLVPGNNNCDKKKPSPEEITALSRSLMNFTVVLDGMSTQSTRMSA